MKGVIQKSRNGRSACCTNACARLVLTKQGKLLDGQETGILFTELCVKQASKSGRIGIVLPNGYLGNRSERYHTFREWLLRHCKLVAVCSFPRFTFKTSGADVSASVVYLQKRAKPLKDAKATDDYNFSVQMIENVGWNLGDKKAAPRFVRNEDDGSFVIDESGNRILDADFASALEDLRRSAAGSEFPWLRKAIPLSKSQTAGWGVSIKQVTSDVDLTIDPKRYCRKVSELRKTISAKPNVPLGDVVDVLPEKKTAKGTTIRIDGKKLYRYVELQDIGYGDFDYVDLRGWQLPQRAKHFAELGDIYVGAIWGSVAKWCFIGPAEEDIVVTNGCHRLRMKAGKEGLLEDVVAFLCTEAYAVQMRSFARGSDGLAEVTPDDLNKVLVPFLGSAERKELRTFVDSMKAGAPDLKGKVNGLLKDGEISTPAVPHRPSHVVLV